MTWNGEEGAIGSTPAPLVESVDSALTGERIQAAIGSSAGLGKVRRPGCRLAEDAPRRRSAPLDRRDETEATATPGTGQHVDVEGVTHRMGPRPVAGCRARPRSLGALRGEGSRRAGGPNRRRPRPGHASGPCWPCARCPDGLEAGGRSAASTASSLRSSPVATLDSAVRSAGLGNYRWKARGSSAPGTARS